MKIKKALLKKLDIYIIRKFLGTFFFAIVLIISISVVFDITERIDDFIEKEAPVSEIIFDYYLNFIPYFANLFSALFTFIAVIFFTSKMAYNTEIIAILSSGVSFKRLMWPYFLSALVIALFSFVLSSYIIPPANKTRLDFAEKYLRNPYRNYDRNIHRQVEPGIYIYMENYNVTNSVGYKFAMEKFVDGKLVSKLNSDYVKFDEESGKWRVSNYYIRNIDGLDEEIEKGTSMDTTIKMAPGDFSMRDNIVETMSLPRLNAFIENQRMHGVENIEAYLIEKYRRFAFPFSTFILTLIGVSLSSRKVKGGLGLHIGLGLLISFAYILFMQISQQFAINGNFNPLLAAWIPNIIFTFIAAYLYKTAPK
ncbi:MAG: LptF/LptG family permease [Bacteroidales bacterium]|nr:LptF/LptG family permease [Bacteroidales bacterium]MCF8457855.1 LptF/LptG family permease [Bacteroidales bacterium]